MVGGGPLLYPTSVALRRFPLGRRLVRRMRETQDIGVSEGGHAGTVNE